MEWAFSGVLFGLGSGTVRGSYAGPATRAGFVPSLNLKEWLPGLARRGPQSGEAGKAHGADRSHLRPPPRPTPRRRLVVGLAFAVLARPNAVSHSRPNASTPSRSTESSRTKNARRQGQFGGTADSSSPRRLAALSTRPTSLAASAPYSHAPGFVASASTTSAARPPPCSLNRASTSS